MQYGYRSLLLTLVVMLFNNLFNHLLYILRSESGGILRKRLKREHTITCPTRPRNVNTIKEDIPALITRKPSVHLKTETSTPERLHTTPEKVARILFQTEDFVSMINHMERNQTHTL